MQILQETLHMPHLLKLLDKMCKYEMDPNRTVGITERTRDGQSETNKPPLTTSLCGGYNNGLLPDQRQAFIWTSAEIC